MTGTKLKGKYINIDSTLSTTGDNLKVADPCSNYFNPSGIGKNMFDKDTMVLEGYYLSVTTGQIVSNATSAITDLIACQPNTEYVISGNFYTTNHTKRYYDADGVFLSWANSGSSYPYFTTPANCYFVQWTLAVANPLRNYDETQLELGHTATSYEAYTNTLASLKDDVTVSHLNNAYLDTQLDDDDAVVKRIWIETYAEENFQPLNKNIIILKSRTDLYLRTVYDDTRDLVQILNVFDVAIVGDNNPMNFYTTHLIPNTNLNTDTTTLLDSSVNIHACSDDSSPLQYSGTYMGANHGNSFVCNLTVTHDKTLEDVGSEWTDGSGRKYYIIRIVDSTHLWVLSENTGTAYDWSFDSTISGLTLTHSANATHTTDIVFSTYASAQMEPAIKNQSKRVFLDNDIEVTSGSADGVYYSKDVVIRDYYEIVNTASALDYIISQVGSAVEIPLNNGDTQVTVDLSYKFDRFGGCLIGVNHIFNQLVNIGINMGGLQTGVVNKGSYTYNYVYSPKTTVINDGSNNWDLTTLRSLTSAPASSLTFTNTYWSDAANPPNRVVEYLGDATDDLDVAFMLHLATDKGTSKNDTRITLTTTALQIATTKKTYMYCVNTTAGDLPAGTFYQFSSFRGYTKPYKYSDNADSVFFYEDGDDVYVIIDYHAVCDFDKISLPTEFRGRNVEIIEKHSDITIHNEFVTEQGIYISCAGTYGYVTLKLTDNMSDYYTKDEVDDIIDVVNNETSEKFTTISEPTGFPSRSASDFSVVGSTLSIWATSGDTFDIWFGGVKHTITAPIGTPVTFPITDVEGLHLIYFDSDDTIKEYINPDYADTLITITQKCLIALVYWDATNNTAVYVGEERHGTVMDGYTHYYLHWTRGLQLVYGLGLNNFVIGDGSNDSHAQFGVEGGSVADEDIGITISTIGSTTGLPIIYKSGSDGYWRGLTQPGFSCYQNLDGKTNRLMYNQYTGGAWQLTEVGEGNYVLYHIFASTGKNGYGQIFSIMGQTEYTNVTNARAGAQVEISNLLLGDLPSVEMKPIATVIYQTDKDYGNDINARIVESVLGGEDYVDWRTSELPRGIAPTSHNNLTNRSDTNSHPASAIAYTPSDGLSTTDVQGAIDELEDEKVPYTGMTGDLDAGVHNIQATEFRMGANAVMKFNAITNSIDFIIN